MFTASLVREVKIGFGARNLRQDQRMGNKGWLLHLKKKDEDESDLRDQRTWATNQRLTGKKET